MPIAEDRLSCRHRTAPFIPGSKLGAFPIGSTRSWNVFKSWSPTARAARHVANFDPALRAFYYARVLEIPTPRWTTYDAKYFHVQMPAEVPMVAQQRAYTSPIWYSPKQ